MTHKITRHNRASVLQEAIDKGKCAVLAKACGVTTNAIYQWKQIPAHHVLTIEKLSGVSRYRQRPDIYGDEPEEEGEQVAA